MPDILMTVSILLAVVSATLAIAAFIFSWVTFRNTSNMQMQAQAILAQVSQKVEVVVERTSQQIDRAWDYFTGAPTATQSKVSEEVAQKEEELRAQISEEVRREAAEVMKKAGLEKETLKSLLGQVESIIAKTTQRTRQLFEQQNLLLKLSEIERELRDTSEGLGRTLPPNIPLEELVLSLPAPLPPGPMRELIKLARFRDMATHDDFDWGEQDIHQSLRIADELLSYLRMDRYERARRKK
jgi:hypothetical protein